MLSRFVSGESRSMSLLRNSGLAASILIQGLDMGLFEKMLFVTAKFALDVGKNVASNVVNEYKINVIPEIYRVEWENKLDGTTEYEDVWAHSRHHAKEKAMEKYGDRMRNTDCSQIEVTPKSENNT